MGIAVVERKTKRDVQKEDELRLQLLCEKIQAVDEAKTRIWEGLYATALRIATSYCRRYHWIDPRDLCHNMLLQIDSLINNYNGKHASKTTFQKYAYHRLYFIAKDVLRKEDPLGICWPQKEHYPEFEYLHANYDAEQKEVDSVDDNQFDEDHEFLESLTNVRKFFRRRKHSNIKIETRVLRAKKNRKPLSAFMRCRKKHGQMSLF